MNPATPPTPAEVERALAEVYARPEFQPPAPSPIREWLGRLWRSFLEILDRLFPDLPRHGESALGWVFIAVLVLTAVAILAHLANAYYGVWRGRERRSTALAAGPAAGRGPRSAAEWEAEARRAAAEGRLREAALALYQALLLRLDARGAVRYDPAKTPGDYRREALGHAEASRLLEGFLRGFEPVAFGRRTLDAAGYERLRRMVAEGGAGG
jgi:hypothetical protein